ncbi:MAG: GNAT family N-acetyltransferase [Lachnospiraceae bacterium]|nr:GNAT family N-acetyltransferase [Lachnospiraceae bacterium]
MKIRRALEKDMEGINRLLCQVLRVHHEGRPDLFQADTKKYTDDELRTLIRDDTRPIFVGVDGEERVLGYAFCVFEQHVGDNILTDIRTLYIDDLCVDEQVRGQHIGKSLYGHVLQFAKEQGCYNVTLNVWACNEGARQFYERCGLVPQKIGMEKILDC